MRKKKKEEEDEGKSDFSAVCFSAHTYSKVHSQVLLWTARQDHSISSVTKHKMYYKFQTAAACCELLPTSTIFQCPCTEYINHDLRTSVFWFGSSPCIGKNTHTTQV